MLSRLLKGIKSVGAFFGKAMQIQSLTDGRDMPRRIELCHEALDLLDDNNLSRFEAPFRVIIQHTLATSLFNNPEGDRADNIEQAIESYKLALQVKAEASWPKRAIHIGGQKFSGKPTADANALVIRPLVIPTYPLYLAQIRLNLGVAFAYRIKGYRGDNIEQAIKQYQLALEVYKQADFRLEWAAAQNNLGQAFIERIKGDPADNIEQAIEHYQQALKVRSQAKLPLQWAQTHNNLGVAFASRMKEDTADNLEQAIKHYKLALEAQVDSSVQWAQTHNNLGNVYSRRIKADKADNLEQAIEHHEQALKVRTQADFPIAWATTQNNLANVYRQRIKGNPADNIKKAIRACERALEVRRPDTLPDECRKTAYLLGYLLYDQGQFASARHAFVTAHQAGETLRGEVQREDPKRQLSFENADIYARLVHTCLLMKDDVAAFEYALAGKGRAFVDTLASGGFDISDHLATTRAADWQAFESLRQEIDNIRIALASQHLSTSDKERLGPFLSARIKEQATLWEELTFKYPNLTATLAAPPLTASQAMTLAADLHATLVEYVEHAGGWSAFVVTKDTIQHVPLENVNEKLLNGVTKWIKNIENKKRVSFGERITRKRLTELHTALIAPLQEQLPAQGERLVLAPFGALHQLPLNAAQNPDTKAYLSQAYTVTFTPSLAALRVELSVARQANWSFQAPESPIHIAHAGHPEMTSLDPLQKPDQSASEMAEIFPNLQQLSEESATLQAAVTSVANRDLVHFYCHGVFEKGNPNQSGLLLHDGFLTVQRIITDLDLKQTHLTALAACETGRVGVTQGEELVGLIQALLTSGSKAVVATLWKVDETPTQTFFQHFYRAIKEGHLPAEALTHATQAIRQTEGWEHPYYWAAFQISGLAHQMPK